MHSKMPAALLLFIFTCCKNSNSQMHEHINVHKGNILQNESIYNDIAAIPVPAGYTRKEYPVNSFAMWLEKVKLKKSKTVYLFNGRKKTNQSAQFAVLDIPVGNTDLQQCADAVMRLRASWLFDEKKFDEIVFFDNGGGKYNFSAPYSLQNFNTYLKTVFNMCGTASLSRQLKKINFKDISAGDVLIRGGFPGHAVIVMDVVINKTGQKKYLLAQSYMPAQDIHLLINPADANGMPWYDVTGADIIKTPEYIFHSNELKSW